MSQFTDTSSDYDIECPYCHHKYIPDAENYNEDVRPDECGECGKKYFLHQTFTVYHRTDPDCELNGIEHNFVNSDYLDGDGKIISIVQYCSVCDKERIGK